MAQFRYGIFRNGTISIWDIPKWDNFDMGYSEMGYVEMGHSEMGYVEMGHFDMVYVEMG